jgi:hypothetical protein
VKIAKKRKVIGENLEHKRHSGIKRTPLSDGILSGFIYEIRQHLIGT